MTAFVEIFPEMQKVPLNSDLYQNELIYSSKYTENSSSPVTAVTSIKVPMGVKAAILIATGYTYNGDSSWTSFSVSGDAIQNIENLLYNYAPNVRSGVLSIYKVQVIPGKDINISFTNNRYPAVSVIAALLALSTI